MFDLYLFDLDGTLINTEYLHFLSYKETFLFYNFINEFTYNNYCKLCHYDDTTMRKFIEDNLNISYEKFYQKKKETYLTKLNSELNLVDGVEDLLINLNKKNIKTCIVSHSDTETINFIINKLPILKLINKVISRDDYKFRKPNSECYIKALSLFPECKNPIGFEDSYKGYLSLKNSNITSVFIGENDYYFFNKLNPKNIINNFNNFNESLIIPFNNYLDSWLNNKLNIYSNTINNLNNNFYQTLTRIIPLISNSKSNIYLTGIGKCGHVCKKSVSTWQSMGISCHYLNLTDLFHGDFGILKESDIIIYISNSGNTIELINCAKYIKNHFKVLQICLTINNDCLIKNHVDYHFIISNQIIEIDNINMAPTVSSIIFMMFLDLIGVYLAEQNNITIEKFQLYHPGGELGKKPKNHIDYVVIVASGLGTRLAPLTKYINKILITFNNKPFIEHLIEYWQNYTKNIIIIYNSQYTDLMKFYTNKYNNITLKIFDDVTGTADTINKTITNEYYHKNILFSWCDILPDENIDISKINNTSIFTYGNECRYKAENNNIFKNSEGNIIGLYYLKDYNGFNIYNIGDDICDIFLKNYKNFNTYGLKKLIDVGDLEKFKKYTNNNHQTRFFNNISFFDNYIIKEACNHQGIEIIKKEINFYNKLNNSYDFFPKYDKLTNNDFSLKLELIKSEPLYKVFKNLNSVEKQNILNQIYEKLDILHKNKIYITDSHCLENINIEAYTKIIDRFNKIKPIINYFGKINKVNGMDVGNFNIIINKLKDIVSTNIDLSYNLIHGDCQFSNIIIEKDTNKIFFIDPRGYFGNSLLYGPNDYDYAKVLYALTGYDEFNNDSLFNIEIQNNEIKFKITNYLDDNLNIVINDKIKAWLVLIWFGLAQYNSNNILKCVASYYNGFYWYNKLFKL